MYSKEEKLNLYNPRDFTFAAHQPNALTAHREEQRRCPRQENPAAYGSFDSNAEAWDPSLSPHHRGRKQPSCTTHGHLKSYQS